jgi:hypothetical protein
MDDGAELFFKYEYGETKDLLKTFVTLISGSLVISLAFAEKIVDIKNSRSLPRALLIACWCLLIAAIVFCGIAMSAIAAAAGTRIYGGIPLIHWEWWRLALFSWAFVLLAGASFVAGLACMVMAAVKSMPKRSEETS